MSFGTIFQSTLFTGAEILMFCVVNVLPLFPPLALSVSLSKITHITPVVAVNMMTHGVHSALSAQLTSAHSMTKQYIYPEFLDSFSSECRQTPG